MKKLLILALALVTLTTVSCTSRKEREKAEAEAAAQQRRIDSLQNALNQMQGENNDINQTLADIQDGFAAINEAEGIINIQAAKGEGANRQTIADNMALIQDRLRQNRELIASLQEQLRNSNSAASESRSKLEKMVSDFQRQLETKTQEIEALRAELASKDIRIAQQDQQITSLNENVNSLAQSNEQKQQTIKQNEQTIAQNQQTIKQNEQTISKQDREMNTVYYVFGTKKELKAQRILDGGDVLKNGNFNRDYFTAKDQRVLKSIPLYSKSAKLMTAHPSGSYSLTKDGSGQYTLHITDASRFWSISRYLVILVK